MFQEYFKIVKEKQYREEKELNSCIVSKQSVCCTAAGKTVIRGELALLTAVIINSFGVVLMLYSGSGISAISSVPYAFSEVFTRLSLGTWTYLFQGLLIFSLMVMRRRIV